MSSVAVHDVEFPPGLRPHQGQPVDSAPLDDIAAGGRSPIIDELPEVRTIRGGASEVPVPSGLTIRAGESAWYGLRVVEFDDDTAQEGGLLGYKMTVLPPDVDGNYSDVLGTNIAWGDVAGRRAGIVIGIDLPNLVEGEWMSAPVPLAGVEQGQVSGFGSSWGRIVTADTFAPGKITDSVPQKHTTAQHYSPGLHRLTQGTKLGIAMVVRRGTVHNLGSSGVLACMVNVELTIALTRALRGFSN